MGREQIIEEGFVDIFDRRHHAGDAGVVDQNVELAELRFRLGHRGFDLAGDAIVGLERQRVDAVTFELGHGAVELIRLKIGDRHFGAAAAEYARMRQPKAGAAAGNQNRIAVEAVRHRLLHDLFGCLSLSAISALATPACPESAVLH